VRVLIAEDEPNMADLLRQGLEEDNHVVTIARDGGECLAAAAMHQFDALVLDVMMPVVDGVEVARRLRRQGLATPILMLTARDAEQDVVRGLDAGADDYLTKPFALKVLLARLRAISRRAARPPVSCLRVADLELDAAARSVTRAGRAIALTATEFRVLEFLLRRAGHAASRSSIIEAVWGCDGDVEPNTVDAYIKLLRDKINAGHAQPLLHTIRGYGYVLREAE
jgi:DNA-binding response OmpR family regulator